MTRDVSDLIAWCRARIAECRRIESKFAEVVEGGDSLAVVEAETERRVLTTVLEMIGATVAPR